MNEPSTSSRRRRLGRGKIAVAVIAVALVGFGAWKYFAGGEEEPEYSTATITIGDIEDLVTATGTLEPRDKVDVGAQVSGQIEKIFVEVGDVVKAGDILAKIDATTAIARVEANRASLEAQRSNLKDRENSLEKAERDFQRIKNLYEADAATEEQFLNARTTLISAQNAIRTLELQIKQQEASMRVEEANLQYTEIKAPIDGTVVSIAAKQGQTINATQSAPTILTIANLDTMTVRAEVSEADYAKLRTGMPAYFTTLGTSATNRRFYGTLKRIEPTPKVQNSVVLYYALFDVDNEKVNDTMLLMPSMTAQVFFVAAEARNVLKVPMAALQQGQQIARERAQREGGQQRNAPRPQGAAPGGATAGSAPPATAQADGAPAPGGEGAPAGAPGAGAPPAGGPPGGEGRGPRMGGGFPGGFPGGELTPEMREQIRQRRAQGGGFPGGFGGNGGFGGGFGMAAQGGRQTQRRGIVMVVKPDGSLEERQVVVGVNDRVHGEVIEGLSEGEEVVVGRKDTKAAAAPAATQQNQNFNFRGPGGPGGFRPF
ncbi:MAG: efflux RND transporter periplasmic adaptor subunit [Pseudomonadota bacterium]|jgi:macrolide-specific efflux system membrane fusion protein